jgi:hypothetical protein
MHIRLRDTRSGMIAEVLCDVCGQMIGLDEDCEYLFPRDRNPPIRTEFSEDSSVVHRPCARVPGRFDRHWSQVTKVRWILFQIAETGRSPVITEFLSQLAADRDKRRAAKDKNK